MMNPVKYQNMTRSEFRMLPPEATLKLASSASEQNVCFTYVCLVNDVVPNNLTKQPYDYIDGDIEEVDLEDVPIKVERSKALHELIESHRHDSDIEERKYNETEPSSTYQTATSCDESEVSETEDVINFNTANPNVLKLTKMKWLTEEQDESPNSSSPSLTPNLSSTSTCSHESDEVSHTVGDKYLSTILRLDREHNMFGLSNIAIVGSNIARPSRKIRKEDEKPAFPQTAIVQICCGKNCCRHRSKTDLPASLKCGGCHNCCADPVCPTCMGPCDSSCAPQPKSPPLCSSCSKASCKMACKPSKCMLDCTTCFGMKISINRKPKYDPTPVELTPRSSCVLDKPFAARSCHHLPRCLPPSSCFPYLMPCFWPARPSAPCSVPARCFHNPPCLAPRKPKQGNLPERCGPGICANPKYPGTFCRNMTCPGKSLPLKEGLEKRFSGQPPRDVAKHDK